MTTGRAMAVHDLCQTTTHRWTTRVSSTAITEQTTVAVGACGQWRGNHTASELGRCLVVPNPQTDDDDDRLHHMFCAEGRGEDGP